MTVLLGPTPCFTCRAPVTVVRRPVVVRIVDRRGSNQYREHVSTREVPLPWMTEVVTVEAGTEHLCVSGVHKERAREIIGAEEASKLAAPASTYTASAVPAEC